MSMSRPSQDSGDMHIVEATSPERPKRPETGLSTCPVELLEEILLSLDLPTLLRMNGVSRQFNTIVKDSTLIQKALFFQPLRFPNESEKMIMENHLPEGNAPDGHDCDETLPPCMARNAIVNPLLSRYLIFDSLVDPTGCIRCTIALKDDADTLHWLAENSGEASWRRMLVIQPHVADVHVVITFDHTPISIPASLQEGIMMAHLVAYETAIRNLFKLAADPAGQFYDTFQLRCGMGLAIGHYNAHSVLESHKDIVAEEICGWQVLESSFGRALEDHAGSLDRFHDVSSDSSSSPGT